MKQLILATGNRDKVRELAEILPEGTYEVQTMKEAGFTGKIIENGTSFQENALIKAHAVALAFPDKIVLADDSGLEVDALGKEPGIYSSRYMGEDTPYEIKNAEIMRRLEDVPREARTARYVCAMAAVLPNGRELTTQETMEGEIAYEAAGNGGFGYDPIFYVPQYDLTAAELTPEQKNAISHRGKALRAMVKLLEEA
jgi:XTP/dITP diphosphohydrolase